MPPAQVDGFEEAVNQTAQPDGGKNRPQPIYTASNGTASFRNSPNRDRCHGHGKREIDQKRPAPGRMLHHPSAENGTNRSGNRRKARPRSNSLPTTFLVERRADNCQASGHEKRSSHALNAPRDD